MTHKIHQRLRPARCERYPGFLDLRWLLVLVSGAGQDSASVVDGSTSEMGHSADVVAEIRFGKSLDRRLM